MWPAVRSQHTAYGHWVDRCSQTTLGACVFLFGRCNSNCRKRNWQQKHSHRTVARTTGAWPYGHRRAGNKTHYVKHKNMSNKKYKADWAKTSLICRNLYEVIVSLWFPWFQPYERVMRGRVVGRLIELWQCTVFMVIESTRCAQTTLGACVFLIGRRNSKCRTRNWQQKYSSSSHVT